MRAPELYHVRLPCTGPAGLSAPHLVAVHGWGANALVWERLRPLVQDYFQLTLIELPGHGRSPEVVGELTAWSQAVLAAAPAVPALWLGWSLGGLLALHLAEAAPAQVQGVMAIASTPRFIQESTWTAALAPELLASFQQELVQDSDATQRRFLALQCRGSVSERDDRRFLGGAQAEGGRAASSALGQGLHLLATLDLRAMLPRLAKPVHWLLGERDALVPASLAMALPALTPTATVTVVPGAAHAPQVSHPLAVAEALLAFGQQRLQSVSPP